jgi:glutamyl-tRNA synthetase
MDYNKLAELLFKDAKSVEYFEKKFPERNLKSGAVVSRIAPSPTGFVHLGNLYNAVIAERLCHQSGGVFFLRIEDTDKKREVPNAVEKIIGEMEIFGIFFDEGAVSGGDKGGYGPYRQRQRKEIYHAFAKRLVQKGMAYPSFATEAELNAIRELQMKNKAHKGYFGEYAQDRNLTYEQIEEKIKAKTPYVLRFKSNGSPDAKIKAFDLIRGEISIQENYVDFVLLKSDGIPTYHFAHVVDDHLMRTTHVIRGEEWIPSWPMHIQAFEALGLPLPAFCHTAVLMKTDGNSKRKLSKRKDPELALSYYREEGYLSEAMWVYLLTVLNSNFEEWYRAALKTAESAGADSVAPSYKDFKFTIEKMTGAGCLFDIIKLRDISKDILSRKTAAEIYSEFLEWAKRYDPAFAKILENRKHQALDAFSIGRGTDNPRKDLYSFKQAREFMLFYFKETFVREDEFSQSIKKEVRDKILSRFSETLDLDKDTGEEWFNKIKMIASDLNFAPPKQYKQEPEKYNGTIADAAGIIRIAVTGRANAPDLYSVCKVLGTAEVKRRIALALEEK